MSNIVISGYYGFGNAGDEAMLNAIVDSIRDIEPTANITVISGNPSETSKKHNLQAVGTFAMFPIMSALMKADLLISGGGSLLQDATSIRNTYYYLSIMSMAKMLGKKVMLYAQGIGPLYNNSTRRAVAKVLKHVDYITVRDEISKEELLSLGITNVPIQVTADAVLAMHDPDLSIGENILSQYAMDLTKKRIGIAVRSWKSDTAYRSELAKALTKLKERDKVEAIFIPMSHPEDTEEAKAICALMPQSGVVLEGPFNTTELLALSGSIDVMIGIRLHALVFSSLLKKPVIGISYDPKIISFLQMIGQQAIGTMAELNGEVLYERIHELLQDTSSYTVSFNRISELEQISKTNAFIALSLLEK